MRDDFGNVMAIYEDERPINTTSPDNIAIKEIPIYGSSRLGQYRPSFKTINGQQVPSKIAALGQRIYEFSNHLGNVLVTLTDFKVPNQDGTYKSIVLSASDYYPFRMAMTERTYSNSEYRYGFNGQEKSDELDENENSYTAEFWQYDSRIGRRWNIDPIDKSWESSYLAFAGNPIIFIDEKGDDVSIGNLHEKNKEGKFKYFRQLFAFELFLLTQSGKKFIKDRAQAGFTYKFQILKGIKNIDVKQSGNLSKKIDANFEVKDLSGVIHGGASGFTESRIKGNKLSTTYFIDKDFSLGTQNEITEDNWKSRKVYILESVNTWLHEIYIHGRDNEEDFLNNRSKLIVDNKGIVRNNHNDEQHYIPNVQKSEYYSIAPRILNVLNTKLGVGLTDKQIWNKIIYHGTQKRR